MSPEWMIAIDSMHTAARNSRTGLADPLEREEWQGLERVSDLFCRLVNKHRDRPPVSARKASFGWTFAQRMTSRRI